ncbi:MAG: VF530 family protein [Kiritimatiellae bacterium]|nr:VF530 family protein [Kiritimatiellia bacterium]
MATNEQPNNPLHGITLEKMLKALVAHYEWSGLGARIDIRCFTHDPSISSSLKFLRKTPWARAKVEKLYLEMKRQAIKGSADSGLTTDDRMRRTRGE